MHILRQVRVVEFDASTPLRAQLEIIAETGVFVSVHTSNLANAQFLQPGSAVFEIIQRNWFWADMDLTFKVGLIVGLPDQHSSISQASSDLTASQLMQDSIASLKTILKGKSQEEYSSEMFFAQQSWSLVLLVKLIGKCVRYSPK